MVARTELSQERGTLRERLLDNGLTVLVQDVHTAPLVSVWCWYSVGSRDEVPGRTGLAHWVEHMNFRGTTNIPRDQIKGIIERFGGTWNGYTWIDQTAYYETAKSDALDHMLFIEAERMTNGLYDPQDCETERAVIISELQGSENDPDQVLDVEVTAAAFKAHPYRNPTIGWIGDLRSVTRDDLYEFYRRHYVPNQARLVIVGDVDPEEAIRLADRRFGSIRPGAEVRRAPIEEPEQRGERRVTIVREGTTAYLKLAYHAPAAPDPDFAPMLVVDAALTGAKGVNLWSSFRVPPPQRSARLYRALVDRRLASAVSGALMPTREPFLYTVSITVSQGQTLAAVEQAALEEIDRAVIGLRPEELDKAKRQLRARMVFDQDSVTNIAHQIGYFATIADLDLYRSLPDRVAAVTLDDVRRVSARYLAVSNRTIGWFKPGRDGAAS